MNRLSYGPVWAVALLISLTTSLADTTTLDWAGLIPPEAAQTPLERRDGSLAFGAVNHFDVAAPGPVETRVPWGARAVPAQDWVQPPNSGFRSDLDGTEVAIVGFITPLEFEGEQITEFLLVPYFGACVHVPPPPANQIVLVTKAGGEMPANLFDPVTVTGILQVAPTEAEFGEIGYRIDGATYRPVANP